MRAPAPGRLPAGGAEPVQLHLPPIDLEPLDGGATAVDPDVHAGEVDVPDPAAPSTDEMVVLVGIHLELRGRAGPVERADQAFPDQLLQVPVDRRVRDGGQDLADLPTRSSAVGWPIVSPSTLRSTSR